jgi:hypothetical protein
MTYSVGNTILAADYNTHIANLNATWGIGSGNAGYGQPALSTLAAGATISATDWNTIFGNSPAGALIKMKNHQGTTLTGTYTNRVAGNTIQAYSTLAPDITLVNTNRANYVANGSDTTATTLTSGSPWATAATHTLTATFPSYDQARYFFNAGGNLRFSSAISVSGGTDAGKLAAWTSILAAIGTIVFQGTKTTKSGGSGTPTILTDGVITAAAGFHQIGTGITTIFKQFGSGYLYSGNFVSITCQGNSSTPNILTFAVRYDDADAGASITNVITTTHTIRPPSTTYLTNTWGSPTLPSGSNSQA